LAFLVALAALDLHIAIDTSKKMAIMFPPMKALNGDGLSIRRSELGGKFIDRRT